MCKIYSADIALIDCVKITFCKNLLIEDMHSLNWLLVSLASISRRFRKGNLNSILFRYQ